MPPEACTRHAERGDLGYELRVDAAVARAVEVDQMHPPCAGLAPAPGEIEGVACPLDDLVVVAARESNGLSAEDVHGGDHFDREIEPPIMTCTC